MERYKTLKMELPELNQRLGGGIPSNATVLLCFQTGAMFQKFTSWSFINQMENPHIIVVKYNEHPEQFIERSKIGTITLSRNSEARGEKLFTIIDCFTQEAEAKKNVDKGTIQQIAYPFDLDYLYSTMRNIREELGRKRWVVWIFSSLTDLSIGVLEEEIIRFSRRLFRLHKNYHDLAFYLLNMDAHSKRFLAVINQLMDIIINFKVEETESKLRNYLQVTKGVFLTDSTKLYYEVDEKGELIFF